MSLSTAPAGFWPTREYLLLHTLAFACVQKHFPSTELVTDKVGMIIADRMRWPYTTFRLDLEALDPRLHNIWSAGKLLAQQAQVHPFAHVDNDFILIDPLPQAMQDAQIFAQSKDEPTYYHEAWALAAKVIGGIPAGAVAFNTGIVGGRNIAAIHGYCDEALHVMRKLAGKFPDHGLAILVEQSCFGDYMRRHGIPVSELIPVPISCVDADFRGRAFTHLWGPTKRDGGLLARIHRRLEREFPAHFECFQANYGLVEGALTRRSVPVRTGRPKEEGKPEPWELDPINAPQAETGPPTAVVVTYHPAYAEQAKRAVARIDAQGFSQKILVLDRASSAFGTQRHVYSVNPVGWELVEGDWSNPNKARNEGLRHVTTPWVCFWDADNVMPSAYLTRAFSAMQSAAPKVAVLYPQVQDVHGDQLGHVFPCPEWSHDNARRYSLVDTGSFWRVESLRSVGGWSPDQVDHDDYELTLRLSRNGWQGQRLEQRMYHSMHGQNRSTRRTYADDHRTTWSLWTAWSFAIVTLWSPGARTDDVMYYLTTADLPPQTSLYWIDNSQGEHSAKLAEMADILRPKFIGITIIRGPELAYDTRTLTNNGQSYLDDARHQHVANLYNLVLPRIHEDMIVTLEDDMMPPANGLRKLCDLMRPGGNVGMVTSIYRSRHSPAHTCLSLRKDIWMDTPLLESAMSSEQPIEVGMSGGGFALIANWALRLCGPMRCNRNRCGLLMGWDGNLGLDMASAGVKLLAHPKVVAEHRCPEVTSYLLSNTNSTTTQ